MSTPAAVEVSGLSPHDLPALTALLTQCDALPNRFLTHVPRVRLEQHLRETLAAKLTAEGSGVLGARSAGELTGVVAFEPLPWETKILNRTATALSVLLTVPDPIRAGAALEPLLAAALQRIRDTGGRLVTAKAFTTDIPTVHALQRQGFLLMDTMVDVTYRFTQASGDLLSDHQCPAGFTVRMANHSDREELRGMARAAFPRHFGRFHSDPEIGPETGTRIYEEWIQACVDGWADWVILAEHQGRIAGFSAWKKPSAAESRHDLRLGHYSIGAIHPDYHGRGLFKTLTLEGMRTLQGVAECIEGPTHVHNIPVQRGYLKLGWQIVDSRHSFHQWLR